MRVCNNGFIITLQCQIGIQQRAKVAQSDRRRKFKLVSFLSSHFGMRVVFYPLITLRNKEPKITNNRRTFEVINLEKTIPDGKIV